MAKRNKTVSLIALPIAASIWLVGWILYAMNSTKRNLKPKSDTQEVPATTTASRRAHFMLAQPKENLPIIP